MAARTQPGLDDLARGLAVAYGVLLEARYGENPDVDPTEPELDLALRAIRHSEALFTRLAEIPDRRRCWRVWRR